jgi:superfamily II RNA helicase
MLTYKHFVLDPFQTQAIEALNANHSVVVSAATGTGKTLIADYIIDKALKEGKRVIYTAPIKALSNQKFRDFSLDYPGQIGLLTGDVVINPQAPMLIMTTEIYRNMLLEKEPTAQADYVIFDEIHYINDRERGAVWEESIIFAPTHTRFVCLSATIPNYQEFANWISHIKGHTVQTVHYMKRAVPLKHLFFDTKLGLCTYDQLKTDVKKYPTNKKHFQRLPSHIDLISRLQERSWLPCIFFSFSRALTQKRAYECAKKHGFVTNEQRKKINAYIQNIIPSNIEHLESTQLLVTVLLKGVGFHHAGLLGKQKELVEVLFDKGLLKVLYATETFAVGINMPAKTVCFGSIEKYDGIQFRPLHAKEYFQLAGRAGRRGIDEIGYSIVVFDRANTQTLGQMTYIDEGDTQSIVSRYELSDNTVLNLIKNHKVEEQKLLVESNFGAYVKKASKDRMWKAFMHICKYLEEFGAIENNALTWKGDLASRIYSHELEIAQLVYSKIFDTLTLEQICIVLAALSYEARRADEFATTYSVDDLYKLLAKDSYLRERVKKPSLRKVATLTQAWFNGCSFDDALSLSNYAEGDVVRFFRQIIDLARQTRAALIKNMPDSPLIEKLKTCIIRLDRDLIKVDL